MKVKNRILILLSLVLLLGASLPEFHRVELRFNGNDVDLNPSILEKDANLYLPMNAFSKLTSLQVRKRDSGEYVLFMDNIFVKFTPNSNIYYLNGKEFTWKNQPFVLDDEIYLPERIFLGFMHFNYDYDQEKKLLNLISASSYDMTSSRTHNRQRVEFAEAKISYELPAFWKRTSINSFASDDKESMKIEVRSIPMGEKSFDESMALALAEKNLSQTEKLPPKEVLIRQTSIHTQGFQRKDEFGVSYYGYSYFELENQLIETSFYGHASHVNLATKVEEEILSSVHFKAYTVDTLDEHYVELDAFFDQNMLIDSLLYSNMPTENTLPFYGSINPEVKEIQVAVSRGKQKFLYTIPVSGGRFNASIPIPFGLGFHHLNFYLTMGTQDEKEGVLQLAEDRNLLLKTSVLNTSLSIALYTSPSDQVLSKHPSIDALTQDIDSNMLDYQKAKTLLERLKEEFTLGRSSGAKESMEERRVNKETAALVYAALLRSMDVPTRVVSNEIKSFYGVEILSNGDWHLCDPYGYLAGDGLTSQYMTLDHKDYGKKIIYYDF